METKNIDKSAALTVRKRGVVGRKFDNVQKKREAVLIQKAVAMANRSEQEWFRNSGLTRVLERDGRIIRIDSNGNELALIKTLPKRAVLTSRVIRLS